MSKYLYPAPGQLRITIEVTSMYGKRVVKTRETGTASMNNVFRQHKEKVKNAVLSAIYEHQIKNGLQWQTLKSDSPEVTQEIDSGNIKAKIIDYDIYYFDDLVTRRREERINKKGEKKIWAVSTSKVTGKQTGKAHLLRKAKIARGFYDNPE